MSDVLGVALHLPIHWNLYRQQLSTVEDFDKDQVWLQSFEG